MDVFRTPDERFDGLPGYGFEPSYADVDGLRMHYVEEGAGDPVVLFHGEPTWAFLYRRVVPALAEHGRVIAPDLVGFGRSDKPTDRRAYTYESHAGWVSDLLSRLDLREATVVVHDWGGPIGLRWAVENAGRVRRLVILNTGIYRSGSAPSKGFLAWRDFAERTPDLPIGLVIQSATATEVPADAIAGYEAPFPTPESKAGAAQFPLIVPIADSDPGAREQLAVRSEIERWDKPALVMFGDSDPVFSAKVGQRFVEAIPGAEELRVIEGAAHFLQEDAGERIAREIADFIDRTG